ncbi:hypothetical protein N0V83_006487 [Neocucurbitaria cava]|uniref:Uncharacterized protein n=1 Tax=Neocucurbitaria cava TaxID=798079 RepID=A0A9W9CL65_9PLEO|nr:hypothetical protein N0V83_006487 [Neocucurbitaria cava]
MSNAPAVAGQDPVASPPRKRNKYVDSDEEVSEDEANVEVDEPQVQAPAPTPRAYTGPVTVVPAKLQFRELEDRKEVNPFPAMLDGYDLTVIHKDYRGRDKPDLGNTFSVARQQAQVMFRDEKAGDGALKGLRVCQGTLHTKHKHQQDKLQPQPQDKSEQDKKAQKNKKKAEKQDKPQDKSQDEPEAEPEDNPPNEPLGMAIKVSFGMDSQMPSVRLFIQRPGVVGEKVGEVTYQIFANCIRPAQTTTSEKTGKDKYHPAGIKMNTYHAQMDATDVAEFSKHVACGHDNLTELAKGRNLMEIRMNLCKPAGSSKRQYRCRPVWSGITPVELDAIRAVGNDPNKANDMPDFERTVLLLDRSEELSIFRRINCGEIDAIERFKNFFVGSMHLCSKYRNFWYYQLQVQMATSQDRDTTHGDIFARTCILEDLEAPRWMVTKFLGHSPVQGAPLTKVEPLNWGHFSKFQRYPTVLDAAFLVRLALARERNNQKRIISGMEKSAQGDCKARFEVVAGLTGGYLLRISLPGAAAGIASELVKPALDTRVQVRVAIIGGQVNNYDGQIVETPGSDDVDSEQDKDYDFVAQVLGREYDFGDAQHPIELEFIDDTTTAHRARNATEQMAASNLMRDRGVDIPALIFRAEPTIAPAYQNAGQDIPQEQFDDIVRRVKNNWKLNDPQSDAVKATFKSDTGLALIYGPPGTGKTFTTTAAAHEHGRIGNKVLYACPSNKAVDAALSAFSHKNDAKLRAVRFVGGYQAFEKRKAAVAPGTDMAEWEGLVNPTMTAAMKANPGTLFHVKMAEAIKTWSGLQAHIMNKAAKDYLARLAKGNKLSGDRARENRKQLNMKKEELAQHFVENEVDIVFTTCSSACHPALSEHFAPTVAFIDEAGQATIPDTCMALDPYKESMKWLTMSGDYNQLMPVVTATVSNEALPVLADSLFRQLLTDPATPYQHVMLTHQYRSHPDIVDWPNKQFYGGRLQSHGSTLTVSPLGKTVRQFFQRLGPGKKNIKSCRMAIDVSGDAAVSKVYGNTTSFCNAEEARIIVGLVRELLAYEPVTAKGEEHKWARVQPSDIGIITPYKGQQRLLRNLLMENGNDTPESKVVVEGTVSTTWGIQGSEVNIAFVSLCVRDPNNALAKTKFAALSNALCVQHTRARQFQVTCGNFKGWLEAVIQGGKNGVLAWSYFEAFRTLAKDLYYKNDIVAWQDIDKALLHRPDNFSGLATSHFYEHQLPSMDPAQFRKKRNAKGDKKYSGDVRQQTIIDDSGVAHKRLGDAPVAVQTPAPAESKRAQKKARQQAFHAAKAAKEAEQAKLNAVLDEGKRSNPNTRVDWSEEVEAAAEATATAAAAAAAASASSSTTANAPAEPMDTEFDIQLH